MEPVLEQLGLNHWRVTVPNLNNVDTTRVVFIGVDARVLAQQYFNRVKD